jgi:CheY-like chemotaxis protein
VLLHHPQAVVTNVLPGQEAKNRSDNGAPSTDGMLLQSDGIPVPVPIIECSLPSQAWVADQLAVAACLTKPITSGQLLHQIERVGSVQDVLVIDDERGFCQLVDQMLEAAGAGFEVRHAYDGAEGLLAMRTQCPDLVLLDLIMPGVDGFQVLDEMRQEPELADVPVVLLTATSYVEDALAHHNSRIVIQRPDGLSPAEVLSCLRAVIGVLEPRYDERSAPEEALVLVEG